MKRAFKSFVEERDDKYTMELLLLPSALKEELLGLVHSPPSTTTPPLVGVLRGNQGLEGVHIAHQHVCRVLNKDVLVLRG